MPAVPKPSQAAKASRPTPQRRVPRKAHELRLPQRGKMARVMEALRAKGGMTKGQITVECLVQGLSGNSVRIAAYLAKKLTLLKA